MLDTAIVERIRECIAAELEPRQATLQARLQGETRELASRGLTGSGQAVSKYESAAVDELKVRVDIVLTAIKRSHASMGGQHGPTTLVDIERVLAEHVEAQAARVRSMTVGMVKGFPRSAEGHVEGIIRDATHNLLRKAKLEAKFYCDELQLPRMTGAAPITIYGNVGAVQTGAFANAHVSLAGHDGERLLGALEAMRQAIEANTEASVEQRAQGGELVGDLMLAVKAERPNGPKIAGLLGGLATTVQTVASLRGAWELVHDAARAVGLM